MNIIAFAGLLGASYVVYKGLTYAVGDPEEMLATMPPSGSSFYATDQLHHDALVDMVLTGKTFEIRQIDTGLYDYRLGQGPWTRTDENGIKELKNEHAKAATFKSVT